jgi:hypothetical protein
LLDLIDYPFFYLLRGSTRIYSTNGDITALHQREKGGIQLSVADPTEEEEPNQKGIYSNGIFDEKFN